MINEVQAYRILVDIGIALSANKDIDSLLERILIEAKDLVNADAGALYLVKPQEKLSISIVINNTSDALNPEVADRGTLDTNPLNAAASDLLGSNIRQDSGNTDKTINDIAVMVATGGKTIIIDDIRQNSGVEKYNPVGPYRSVMTVPLKNHQESTIGVLQLINAKDDTGDIVPFDNMIRPLIEALSSQASIALENRHLLDNERNLRNRLEKEVYDRTEQLKIALDELSRAHITLKDNTTLDPVTGIRNRQYFDDVYDQEWRRAVRQQYAITLLIIDIDHFKRVNDTFGHLVGDICLAEVANAINELFNRPADVVARYGGEEFAVVLPHVEGVNAANMAEQVRSHVEDLKIEADGNLVQVTISIGRVTVVAGHGLESRDFLSMADQALYRAKSDGRNRVTDYFEPCKSSE